jgi:hypothetical protein
MAAVHEQGPLCCGMGSSVCGRLWVEGGSRGAMLGLELGSLQRDQGGK